jgi:pyrroloquinoline quinone biosynthesis protein B
VAIGDDRGQWFLVNASPDLPAQILSFSELHPQTDTLRGTPIAAVLLTNADLDHVLGLFLLREGGRLHIYAPNAVRETLDNAIGLTPVLDAFCGIAWHSASGHDFAPLESEQGKSSLLCRAIGLPGKPPLFAKDATPAKRKVWPTSSWSKKPTGVCWSRRTWGSAMLLYPPPCKNQTQSCLMELFGRAMNSRA